MKFLARFRQQGPEPDENYFPSLTVFIPAYNEENDIAAKLNSVLAQDYPQDKLEILVTSDVSTDRTAEIVRSFAGRGVTLIELTERHGKLGAIDRFLPEVKGEVIVVTDANVMLGKDALRKLMAVYIDPSVGAASGYQTVEHPDQKTKLREEVAYRTQEALLKTILSRFGLLVGAFGGFYSIRRECFRPIGPKPMDDDIILPLEAMAQGYKVVFVPEAVGYEAIGGTTTEEYRRRIRMTAYNFNAIGRAIRLGAKAGFGALYVVFSYKILRWLAPFFWLSLALSSLILSERSPLYSATALFFGIGFVAAGIGWLYSLQGKRIRICTQAYYFALMNFATFPGLLHWLRGVKGYWGHRAA